MKDGCYGFPGLQQKVKYVHCKACRFEWALRRRRSGCAVCGGPLTDGKLSTKFFIIDSDVFDKPTIIRRKANG